MSSFALSSRARTHVHEVNGHRRRGTLCFIPLQRQIFPSRIEPRNQPEFLLAAPALQLLFAVNGIPHIIEALLVYEANCIVVVGETFEGMSFVLPDSPVEVVGQSNI